MGKKRIQRCPHCGSTGVYYEKYDAYACDECDVWIEGVGEGYCLFCMERPERPSLIGTVDFIRGERG